MQDLVQLLVSGVALGSVYALAALGFVIVYSATGLVNFAAGQLVMFGAMFGVTTGLQLGRPMPVAIPRAVAMMGLFGFLFYLCVHLPLRTQPPVTVVMQVRPTRGNHPFPLSFFRATNCPPSIGDSFGKGS